MTTHAQIDIELNPTERKALAASFFAAANGLAITRSALSNISTAAIPKAADEMSKRAVGYLRTDDDVLKDQIQTIAYTKAETMLTNLKSIPKVERTEAAIADVKLQYQEELVLEFFEAVESRGILDRSVLESTPFVSVLPERRY